MTFLEDRQPSEHFQFCLYIYFKTRTPYYRWELKNWTYKDSKCLTQYERVLCGRTLQYFKY